MKRVYKYQLEVTDLQVQELREGYKILHVASQHDTLCIWVEVDTQAPPEMVRFLIVGTGHAFPPAGEFEYVGTALMLNGNLVWHLYVQVEGKQGG